MKEFSVVKSLIKFTVANYVSERKVKRSCRQFGSSVVDIDSPPEKTYFDV